MLLLLIAVSACTREHPASAPERHYPLSGTIIALNPSNNTATIDGAAIPGFMDAMTMEYPIRNRAELEHLHVGEKIKATVNVSAAGDTYNVSGIEDQNAAKQK